MSMPKRRIERVKVAVCPDEGCDQCLRAPYGSNVARHGQYLYRCPTISDTLLVFCRSKCAREFVHREEAQHDYSDWPREPANGRLLCAPDRPMPKGAPGSWAHTGTETVASEGDFSTGQEYDKCRCKDCGHEWWHEVPQ